MALRHRVSFTLLVDFHLFSILCMPVIVLSWFLLFIIYDTKTLVHQVYIHHFFGFNELEFKPLMYCISLDISSCLLHAPNILKCQ